MAGQSQSPSSGQNKKPPKRPPMAQALKKAVEAAQSADDVDTGPTGQSPLRKPAKTHVLQ